MITHSSVLAWRIPWTEEPGVQSMGSQRVERDWSDSARTHVYIWLIHFAVQQKLTQHCKATIPRSKTERK